LSLAIAVLGGGAWGTTLAQLFSAGGHQLRQWRRSDGDSALDALQNCELVVSAVALVGVEPLAQRLNGWPQAKPLVSCSKGLDPETGRTASQIWQQHCQQWSLFVLSGPNLAAELRRGLPAASVLAGSDEQLLRSLQGQLSTECLRLYRNQDPLGTELAAGLKNVMAIAAGVCDGLGLGANARASLLTRALAEMELVMEGMGGRSDTLYGLAGLGDLLATATSPLSRNYRFGLALAKGETLSQALEGIAATVEGVPTTRALIRLARERGWSLPIVEQVQALLEARISPPEALRRLMERQLRSE
jgi:glycerol-3-phosphate dehydrogenase (NAD(P)+)